MTVELLGSGGAVAASTTTAADGSYTFTNVAPGSYSAREADPSGFVSTTSNTVAVNVKGGGAATANFGDQQQGTVSGNVYNDLNGNGAQDSGESGLGGVTVELLDADGNVIDSTTTAGDGTYSFTSVDPGSYNVRETDPGGFVSTTSNIVPVSVSSGGAATANFGDQQQGTVSGTVYDDANGNGTQNTGESGLGGVTVELLDADGNVVASTTTAGNGAYSFTDVDPDSYTVRETDPDGFVSTTRNTVPVSIGSGGAATANFGDQQQGTVSGNVYNDLNGDGAQGAGEPGLGGVTVELLDGDGNVVASATTDDSGAYSFTSVDPSSYTVRETDPDGFVSTTRNTVPVNVGSGGAATANFGDQQQGTVSGSVYNDLNGDGTQGAGESGIGGVTVELLDADGNVVDSTTTTGNGAYSFTEVDPGSYRVRETDPDGFVSTTSNRVAVNVGSGGAATANFGDQQQGTVSGTVFEDRNGDGGQGAGEPGLGGVTVELLESGNVIASTTTAGNGTYSFTDVDPGSYTVRETDPDGFVSTTSNRVAISVGSGGSASANFGDQQTGTVSGTVYNDANGNGAQNPGETGVGGVTVELIDSAGQVVATATTTGDGAYSFTGVVPGSYTVRETDPAGYVSTTRNTVSINVSSGGAATANFGDQQTGTVSGVVYNDANGSGAQNAGEPGVGGVTVKLLDTDGNVVATTTTAGDGTYSFTGVTPGSYTVRETDPDGFVSTTNNTVPVNVGSGGAATANFGDQQQGTVSGTVFSDPNGDGDQGAGESGIGGVTVELLDAAGNVMASTTTAGNGSYSFTDVDPGSYRVRETDPAGFVSTTSNQVLVNVGSGGAATANFGDQQTGTVSGVVYNDANGNGTQNAGESGIGGVTVELLDADGNVVASTTTAGNGAYSFADVIPDSYIVRETDPAGFVSTTNNTVPISVVSGGAATANFGDQPVGTVSGTVFNDLNGNGVQDRGESGVSGVAIELVDSDGGVVDTTTTAGDGTYSFGGVAPGSYTVRETDPTGFISTTSNTVSISVGSGGAAMANFGDRQTGTVSGQVFNDLNGDGEQSTGEPGIGGVTVELFAPGTDGLLGNADDVLVATATTAGNGTYLFTELLPGNYAVRETNPDGFFSTTPDLVPAPVVGGGSATANFGDQPVGTVAGTVFNDFNGNSTRDRGEAGIGGVTIELFTLGDDGLPGTADDVLVESTTTAGDGSYSFRSVIPGGYMVQETDPPGFASTTSNIVPISIPPGGAAGVRFGDQALASVAGVVFDDLNGNGVQGPREVGIGGVTVELISAGADGVPNTADDSVAATTTTAGDGTYVFTGVVPGHYAVRETDPAGFISSTPNFVPVSLGPSGSATANFGDQAMGTVVGTVFNDLNGNGVQKSGEPGIGDVTIELFAPGPDGLLKTTDDVLVATTTTTDDGSYAFDGIVPGSYVVQETDPAGFTSTTDNIVPVTIPSGGAASAQFGDQALGFVTGVVFNDLDGDGVQGDDEPEIGGVTLELINEQEDVIDTATTVGNGTYLFTGVVPGIYTVRETDPPNFISTTPNEVQITVPTGGSGNASFGDQPIGIVTSLVFFDIDGDEIRGPGEPGIGGVTVSLSGQSTRQSSRGLLTLFYEELAPKTLKGSEAFRVSDAAPFSQPRLYLAGFAPRLWGSWRSSLSRSSVFVAPGDDLVETATTTSNGTSLFIGVVAGDYMVQETDPEGFTSTTSNDVPVNVPAGGSAHARFGDRAIGTISGVVFNDLNDNGVQEAGEPGIRGVVVKLFDADNNEIATATTASNGFYSFAGLTAGDYTVQETDPDGFISTTGNAVSVTVPVGGSASARFGDELKTPAPTGIELQDFTAQASEGDVTIRWEVIAASDNLGFNLWRSSQPDGEYEKVNPAFIPSRPGGIEGASYEFVDRDVPAGTWYYKLETLSSAGQTDGWYGPIAVQVGEAGWRIYLPLFVHD